MGNAIECFAIIVTYCAYMFVYLFYNISNLSGQLWAATTKYTYAFAWFDLILTKACLFSIIVWKDSGKRRGP